MNFKHFIEGVINTFQAKKEIESIAQHRYSICIPCNHNSTNAIKNGYKSVLPFEHCTLCKCNLTLKTHSLHASCPIKKWESVLTKEESDLINEKIKSSEQSL